MACDKPRAGRLLHDDVDNILTVEVTGMAQEGLFAVVVILGKVLKLPGETSIRQARDLLLAVVQPVNAREASRTSTSV